MAASVARDDPFPAPSKTADGAIGGIPTTATSIFFSDRILITLSQDGRLAQWVQVPLSGPSPALPDTHLPRAVSGSGEGALLLPASHLTPTTLLGGVAGGPGQRETLGHLYAAQVASQLLLRDPDERRTLVLGLGLRAADADRAVFFDVLELAMRVL